MKPSRHMVDPRPWGKVIYGYVDGKCIKTSDVIRITSELIETENTFYSYEYSKHKTKKN